MVLMQVQERALGEGKRGGGRPPSGITPDKQAHFCSALCVGSFISTAALFAGIALSTLSDWRRTGVKARGKRGRLSPKERAALEFLAAYEKAEAESEVRALAIIAAAASWHWQAAAWRLERRLPDRWARRRRVDPEDEPTGTAGGPVIVIEHGGPRSDGVRPGMARGKEWN